VSEIGDKSGGGGRARTAADYLDIPDGIIPFFNLNTLGIRIRQYVGGIVMTVDNPLFGVGGANYPYVAPVYNLPSRLSSGNLFPLHNMYIAVLAETGVPGFITYMLSISLVLVSGWRLFAQWTEDFVFAISIIASAIGYLAVMFWYPHFKFGNLLTFWLIMGGVVAATTTSEE
jgi:O-antigen ligase